MKWLAVTAALAFSTAAVAAPLLRVASVSVCGDLYALMLADHDQIAAVSPEAEGPLAWFADRAKGLPRDRGDLESLLMVHADVVLLDEGSKPQLVRGLQRLGIKTVILPSDARLSDVGIVVRRVAAALDQRMRGEAVIADMQARLKGLQAERPLENRRPIALYFRPDGGGTGGGTFMSDMMELAGFRNMQAMLGQKGWRSLPLEAVVEHPPQLLITGFFDTQARSLNAVRGSKLDIVTHARVPVIALPGRGMVCASPALVAVAEQAGARRKALFPQVRP